MKQRLLAPVSKGKIILIGLGALVTLGAVKVVEWTADPTTPYGCAPSEEGTVSQADYHLATAMGIIDWFQRGGTINDASCLDETAVHGIVKIETEEDIVEALRYAAEAELNVSVAGVRHSMGGQAFGENNLVLDMLDFNDIEVDREAQTMRVQSGATWHDIQNKLQPDFAVSAMQSTDIFSVGGSISVNAHGMDHMVGAVENSIVSMRVMLPDGSIETVSRTENTDLYEAVVGGYGLFGIILDATLRIVPNDIYTSKRVIIPTSAFPQYFEQEIETNPGIGLMYTHLSTAPSNLLEEAIVYVYEKADVNVASEDIPPLQEVGSVKLRRFFMSFSKTGSLAQEFRWWAEKYLEPKFESCSISRASAIGSGEACFVARNEPMHDSVPYLYNNMPKETDILHEYFIPRENLVAFVDDLRKVVKANDITLLNASVRVVRKETGLLSYAPEAAYSVVLFINQPTTEAGTEKMKRDTQALVDISLKHNGRFFLPYQLHYTKAQLTASYPELDTFLARKLQYDPEERLQSTFYNYLKR